MTHISFLSDYGLADEFVGVCKGVIAQLAPDATVIDITHEIPAFDIGVGATTLARSVQYLPPGVVLAVVDPGVGTARRGVAVKTETGFFVGPDNGLLAPAVAMAGGAVEAVELTNEEMQLAAPGPTFAGRDIFAPAAAQLANGVGLADLGPPIDPITLTPGTVNLPRTNDDGTISAQVWWVDRYGNAQLNVDPDELRLQGCDVGANIGVQVGAESRSTRWVRVYADGNATEIVLLTDSYGMLSLAQNQGSAAKTLKLSFGSAVTLIPPGAKVPKP